MSKKIHSKPEDAVSTLGFLTIVASMALLTIGFTTFNINDEKAKIDRSVEFDIKNIAAQTNEKISDEKKVVIVDNKYIGHDKNGIPLSENSPITRGTIITASGDSRGYCLFAINANGNDSSGTKYVYASAAGGFHILDDGQNCKDGLIQTLNAEQ